MGLPRDRPARRARPPPLGRTPNGRASGSAKLAGTELIGLTHKQLSRIRGNVALMDRLASELLARARAQHPGIDDRGITATTDAATPLLGPQWYASEAAVA